MRCGVNPRRVTLSKNGKEKLGHLCDPCKKESRAIRLRNATKFSFMKKGSCERCGFVAEDKCQLDLDHIDGNRDNNDATNLMTLCANCHRLKTKNSKDADWSKGFDVHVTVNVVQRGLF